MKSNVKSTLKYISTIKILHYLRFHIDYSYNIVVQFASNDFQSWIYNLYIDLGSGFNSLIIEVCLIPTKYRFELGQLLACFALVTSQRD